MLGNGKNVSLNITQTLIGIILDDPDMRAVFERSLGEAQAFPGPADRPYKSGTGMSRLSIIQEKITSLFQAMLGKNEPDLAEVANKVASLHADAKVNNAMVLKAGFALEDALKDKGLDIPPEFYKRLRSFMLRMVEFYDQRRTQAEELAELKERYYRATFEASQSGMAVVDAKGPFCGVNDRAAQLLGYSKDEVLDPGFSWTNLLSEEGLKGAKGRIEELIKTGKPQRAENVLIGKNGREIPVIISCAKLPRQPGFEMDRLIVDILDVTELKIQQDYVNNLLKLIPIGMFTFDLETAQTFSANPLLLELLGYKEEGFLQKTLFELLPEELHGQAKACIQKALETGEKSWVRWPMLKKDGTHLPVMISCGKVYDPCVKKDTMAVFVVDVSESERAKAEMEAERSYWRTIFDCAGEAMAVFDLSGRIFDMNESLSQQSGYSRDEALAEDFSWFANLTAPEDREKMQTQLALLRNLEPGSFVGNIPRKFLSKNGVKIYTTCSAARLPEPFHGRYVMGMMDITKLKEAQKKLQELVEAQQQTIKDLSTPLIPIWSKVLMAPLLGSFDSMRMHDLSERLLEYVASQKPKAVLLDLTGLAHVDTQVISEIVRLIASLRLLGSRAILVGIKPHVAQSLVRLGASLEGIPTHATLEQGLRGLIGDHQGKGQRVAEN